MSMHILFLDNDTVIQLKGLRDRAGVYINGASVKLTIYDNNNVAVTGVSWPTTLVYVASSDGDYEYQIDNSDPNFIEGNMYRAQVTATVGVDISTYNKYFVARERTL